MMVLFSLSLLEDTKIHSVSYVELFRHIKYTKTLTNSENYNHYDASAV